MEIDIAELHRFKSILLDDYEQVIDKINSFKQEDKEYEEVEDLILNELKVFLKFIKTGIDES